MGMLDDQKQARLSLAISKFQGRRSAAWFKSYTKYEADVKAHGCPICAVRASDLLIGIDRHYEEALRYYEQGRAAAVKAGQFHCSEHQQPAEVLVGLAQGFPVGALGHTAIAYSLPPERPGAEPKWRVINVGNDLFGAAGDEEFQKKYARVVEDELTKAGIKDDKAAAAKNPKLLERAYVAAAARLATKWPLAVFDEVVPARSVDRCDARPGIQ